MAKTQNIQQKYYHLGTWKNLTMMKNDKSSNKWIWKPSLEYLTAIVGVKLIVAMCMEMSRRSGVPQCYLNISMCDWSNHWQLCMVRDTCYCSAPILSSNSKMLQLKRRLLQLYRLLIFWWREEGVLNSSSLPPKNYILTSKSRLNISNCIWWKNLAVSLGQHIHLIIY